VPVLNLKIIVIYGDDQVSLTFDTYSTGGCTSNGLLPNQLAITHVLTTRKCQWVGLLACFGGYPNRDMLSHFVLLSFIVHPTLQEKETVPLDKTARGCLL
jgi:hypothetical protein